MRGGKAGRVLFAAQFMLETSVALRASPGVDGSHVSIKAYELDLYCKNITSRTFQHMLDTLHHGQYFELSILLLDLSIP